MQTLLGHHWHHLPSEEVLELLESDETGGLDRFAVETRQAHFGRSVFSENPAANQAPGPSLNPVAQALPDSACVVYRLCTGM